MISTSEALEASYAACRRVARRSGSNFYPAFFLLPRRKRRAMVALYAFMRHTDDLSDSCRPVEVRRQALSRWRANVEAALEAGGIPNLDGLGGSCPLPSVADRPAEAVLPAVADTVGRFQIPPEHLLAVIDGVEMDLHERRYETFDELAEYCHCVASAVGLACIHVWGFRGPEAVEPARRCGLALQLTNILRDLKEDAERGRVYLPLEDLRRLGYSAEDLAAGVADERFVRLVRDQSRRAWQLYHEGAELIRWLEPDGRRVFGMILSLYRRLQEKIERDPGTLLVRRIRLNRWEKLRIAARWTLLPPRRSALP